MNKFLLLILSIIFISCSNKEENEIVVVTVNDEELTLKKIKKDLGNDVDENSISYKVYINNWIKNQVLIDNAKENLAENEKNFEKKINDYYNSLLKYSFEQKIIQQELDTNVSFEEIKEYYDSNMVNFELKENIVKVRYVKVNKKNKDLNKFKYLIQYKDSLTKDKFLDLVEKNKVFSFIGDDDWMPLEEVKSLIPIKLYNEEHFLSHYKYTEAPDNEDIWIVYFKEHRLKDNISPIKLVNNKIRNIIINKRKLKILNELDQRLINQATKSGKIKYN